MSVACSVSAEADLLGYAEVLDRIAARPPIVFLRTVACPSGQDRASSFWLILVASRGN